MFPIILDDKVELRLLTDQDAPLMFDLVTRNRAHLDQWLRWSARVQTLDDVTALIRRFAQKYADGDGFHAGIWFEGQLAGGLVCHYIIRESSKTEIGYWLGAEFVGKGLASRAARAVINHLFAVEKLHRIEIQCGVGNFASRAIPERLGFTQEGIKRESDWITTRYVDHVLYAMLAADWDGE